MTRLSRVGVDRFDSKTMSIALVDQPFHRILSRPRSMGSIFLQVQEGRRVADAIGPVGTKYKPCSGLNSPITGFPFFEELDGQ